MFAGKLTWRASENSAVILSVFGDPSYRESVAPSLYSLPMPKKLLNLDPILGKLEDGGMNLSLTARHVFSRKLFIEGGLSRYSAKQSNVGKTERILSRGSRILPMALNPVAIITVSNTEATGTISICPVRC
ncbi:hypothetical protein JXJ21_02840 [candidate division KSB1 bacterium]|nr:hypothetical protein [candidate division KSB1 bacterium]